MSNCEDHHVDCDKALKQVWAYLDGELSEPEAKEFEKHVSLCTSCNGAHDFERRLLEAVRATEHRTRDAETAQLAERVRTAIKQAKRI